MKIKSINKYKSIIYIIIIIILFIIFIKIKYNIENFTINHKIYLINYANKGYIESRKNLKKSALENGVDEVIEYNLSDIDNDFKNNNIHFSYKKGGGYWIWKPYFILKTFEKINNNDILIYCDSGATITKSLLSQIELLNNYSIILYNTQNSPDITENIYTKMDIFKHFNCEDNKEITHSRQIEAGFIILKKNSNSIDFISKWLETLKIYNLISDDPSIEKNFNEFKAHRNDQSILSVLGKLYKDKYNILIYPTEKDFIEHHRRND
jgi:hypothetical protein